METDHEIISKVISPSAVSRRIVASYWGQYQHIQSTLVISNSKGLSEILRDIRTSTYQICRIEEKLIRLITFNKYVCNLTPEIRDILKILWKRGEKAISPLFHNIFYLFRFHV